MPKRKASSDSSYHPDEEVSDSSYHPDEEIKGREKKRRKVRRKKDKPKSTPKKENQHHKQENSETPPGFANNSQDLEDLSKICMVHLKKVTQTAIQFQRHSHSKQLCSTHFSKALVIHGFHFESDFYEDFLDFCTPKKRR